MDRPSGCTARARAVVSTMWGDRHGGRSHQASPPGRTGYPGQPSIALCSLSRPEAGWGGPDEKTSRQSPGTGPRSNTHNLRIGYRGVFASLGQQDQLGSGSSVAAARAKMVSPGIPAAGQSRRRRHSSGWPPTSRRSGQSATPPSRPRTGIKSFRSCSASNC
jgi:hypothetical protein